MVNLAIPIARQIYALVQAGLVPTLLWCALIGCGIAPAGAEPLFDPPEPTAEADEILLFSTRSLGTACDSKRMSEELKCQRYEIGDNDRPLWKACDWRTALQLDSPVRESASPMRTVIYVHGNRIEPGEDRRRGMMIYRSLVSRGKPNQPIRFVIWSWPSTTVPGLIKDMKIKAARTCPAGWQLAWFLDQLPEKTPLSLIGYSYGARVASGALHVLGGGRLGGKQLTERLHPGRPPIRVAMVAAAFDADWILPGKYHGRAVSQMEELILITNQRDPAMRLFHFSVDRGRIHALGKEGVSRPQALGRAARRIRPIDMTQEVGRSHLLVDYLAVTSKMGVLWRRLVPRKESIEDTAESSLAGAPAGSRR
jgi:hypothetical protein